MKLSRTSQALSFRTFKRLTPRTAGLLQMCKQSYWMYCASCIPEAYFLSPRFRYLSLEADYPLYLTGL